MKKNSTPTKSVDKQNQEKLIIAGVIMIPVLLAIFLMFNQSRQTVPPAPVTVAPTATAVATLAATEPAAAAAQATATDSPFQIPAAVAARNGKYSAAPPMSIDPKKIYYATFKTVQGDIKVQLFADRTPVTVNNFVFLARDGFYDNTTFHFVVDNTVQGGDPTGTGGGGPGYTIGEEYAPGLVFDKPGLLAMANAGPGTTGSQFFFVLKSAPELNGLRTIFGEVVEGMDVLQKITPRNPNGVVGVLGDALNTVVIEESDTSILPTATPLPPTATPFSPSQLDLSIRPLATMTAAARSNYFNAPPSEITIEKRAYTATMITSRGIITFQLKADLAPIAVNNFVLLANLGFYDNTPVNLISDDNFVILGAPANKPESDAGYSLKPEMELPVEPKAGLLAYVPKTNDPSSASSSQLFITLGNPGPQAPKQYSFFGEITSGLEVVKTLTTTDTVQSITIEK